MCVCVCGVLSTHKNCLLSEPSHIIVLFSEIVSVSEAMKPVPPSPLPPPFATADIESN